MPRFRDYTAASFQRAHVNVCTSVSKIYIKVHKAQIEQKGNVVVVVIVVVVAILRYLGLCREANETPPSVMSEENPGHLTICKAIFFSSVY